MRRNQLSPQEIREKLPTHLRDLVDELVRAELRRHDDDDEEDEIDRPFPSLQKSPADELEERGVIILDKEISKQTLAKPSARLLSLHLNPQFNDTVQIVLNSPGGYTDAMWAFIDLMESSRLHIRTVAMGQICSAATMIFIAGDERVMAPNSTTMIHHYSDVAYGTHYDLVAARKEQDMEAAKVVGHLLKHSKYSTAKEVESKLLLKNDNWLTPTEMKKHGLCDILLKPRRRPK